jgi:glycosyltransferase involved in cell wall biosynthesis
MPCGLGRLSIIIPALDEAPIIVETLAALAPLHNRGAEVIVVDGGSSDGTPALAIPLADRVISAPRNRGAAMNAGAALASGDVFLFLHADTILPANADRLIAAALAPGAASSSSRLWGRFDLRIAGQHRFLANRRPNDQLALAAHRNRHRRSGDLCGAESISRRRRLSRSAVDGRHRAIAQA